jgi:multidrug efflux pump
VMGGMLAATFLAIFFVPWFFRVLVDRRLQERRSVDELRQEARLAHEQARGQPA